jgi:Dolichyl-phosphate-mannose-protein mannosyltransferase
MQAPPSPPRWLSRAIFVGLAALLYFPLHVPYQNPDQDYPGLALFELVRGGWRPWTIYYPSALTNLLRFGYESLLLGARLTGSSLDAVDLLAAFGRDPTPFRIAPRFIAMTAGVLSLVAVTRLTALLTDRWSALFAALLLGTSYMFVREHHHGMFDAPAASAVMLSLYFCGRHVVRPSAGAFAAAVACAALALSFKYNAAVVLGCPVLALWLAPAPTGGRLRAVLLALVAGIVALLFTSPFMVIEPLSLVEHLLAVFDYFQKLGRVVSRQGGPVYGFGQVLRNGLGLALLAAAVLGALAVVWRKERALVPLVCFTALYGWIVWRSPLVFNRYALPIAAPGAVLAAYGLHRGLPFWPRVAAVVALVAVGLPSCLAYDHLLAQEDTRVSSARWLRENVRPDARIFLPGDIMTAIYVGPDIARPLGGTADIPPERVAEVRARIGPGFPTLRRYFMVPRGYSAGPPGAGRLAPWANGIVITSELREGVFAAPSTPLEVIRDLESHAVLLADYPVERQPDGRVYEPEMNYMPMRGLRTLIRPGPRIRIWYIPAISPGAEPSPLLDGRTP